jgi:hypothetical protein
MIKSRMGHAARMEREGNPEGKRLFGRLGYRWESNIRMHLRGRTESMDWIDVRVDGNRAKYPSFANMVLTFGCHKK